MNLILLRSIRLTHVPSILPRTENIFSFRLGFWTKASASEFKVIGGEDRLVMVTLGAKKGIST
jgi:hypothetical protein